MLTLEKPTQQKLKAHHHQVKLMGCRFVLTAVSTDKQLAWDGIRAGVAEITRIENMISSWKNDSYTNEINLSAGVKPVKVPRELMQLIQRSIRVSQLTAGAFDICGTLSRDYWTFDNKEHVELSPDKINELRILIDFHSIEIDEEAQTVFLKKPGMKIGFGGIGKGYAAFRAKIVMEKMGLKSGLINAAGDLMCWGSPPQGGDWEIHIPDPHDRNKPLQSFHIPNGSVVTSGNYENYTLVNGKRLSHIIDPRTGRPVEALKCVSVICPNPELGDALATAISVLGTEHGLALIDQLQGVECLVIDQDNQSHYSNHLKSFI